MAICRWSTEDFTSDVYIYESLGGIEIHVAGRRLILDEPLPVMPDITDPTVSAERWLAAHQVRRGIIDRATRVCIGGPFDGASFVESDDAAALGRLRQLADAGYRIPACAWDALSEGSVLASRGGRV